MKLGFRSNELAGSGVRNGHRKAVVHSGETATLTRGLIDAKWAMGKYKESKRKSFTATRSWQIRAGNAILHTRGDLDGISTILRELCGIFRYE
jgi:hypothetical protein